MKYLIYISGLLLLLCAGCGGKSNDPGTKPPVAAALVFPEQNAICISGNVISKTQSSVVFKWNAALYTDTYDITIKNLITNEITTQSSTAEQATITLSRNTPFSWYITSKATKNTAVAKSEIWKFYNAGDGVISYAPFPADDMIPKMSANVAVPSTNSISLSWQGSDADNDIISYDVFFGNSAAPPLFKQNYTSININVPVTTKTTYYWKVVTHDSKNNTSTSDIVQFNTN